MDALEYDAFISRFFQSEPPRFEHASPSNVRDELLQLAELGMLDIERPDDSRRAYYVRTNIELGQLIEAAAEILDIEVPEG